MSVAILSTNNIGVIPARLHSTRLPKKILADIGGKPMVIRTAAQVSKVKKLNRVIIAIDSDETHEALKDFGYELVMTSKDHQSGTDRVAEAVESIKDVGVVVNIQADEPFVDPGLIDRLIDAHSDPSVGMSTLVSTQLSPKDRADENVVKVYLDEAGFATDFKRICGATHKHLGIYGFTKETLVEFVSLEQTDNEKTRSLEQMRALDNGIKIKAVLTSKDCLSINTLDDLSNVYRRDNIS